MAHTMPMDSIAVPVNHTEIRQAQKAYSVNLKGLIAHLLDILFVDNTSKHAYYADEMSSHIQRDIGMYR